MLIFYKMISYKSKQFLILFSLVLAVKAQVPRNSTCCQTVVYRHSFPLNHSDSANGNSEFASYGRPTTSNERRLHNIEVVARASSDKLEVVLQVLAETTRSLLYIERRLREHDESNSVLTQQLKRRIEILEERTDGRRNIVGVNDGDYIDPPNESTDEGRSSTTESSFIAEDVPFIRRQYSSNSRTAHTVNRSFPVHSESEDRRTDSTTAEPARSTTTETPITSTTVEESVAEDVGSANFDESMEETTTVKVETDVTTKVSATSKKPKKQKSSKVKISGTEIAPIGNVSNHLLDQLMRHPRARLFTEENFQGEFMDYHSDHEGDRGCTNLKEFARRIQSVDSYTTCVRVFLDEDCQGWSQAIYDGSSQPKSQVLNGKLAQVRSIGRCIENEFTNAISTTTTINLVLKKDIVTKSRAEELKLFHIPDLIEFRSDNMALKAVRVRDRFHVVTNYLRGYGGRLEFSESMVYRQNLRSPEELQALTANKNEVDSSSSSESDENQDIVGFALPLNLGGSADEKFNLFPQSVTSLKEWEAKLNWIPYFISNYNSWVTISLNFVYENETSTRPSAFAYYIDKYNQQFIYGYMEN